jgi:phosphate ABC transporter permease protein PstC/phosphate ABC transporter permease subunit PstA
MAVSAPRSLVLAPPGPAAVGVTGLGDRLFHRLCQGAASLLLVGLALLVVILVWKSALAIRTVGLNFLAHTDWDPVHRRFGALAFVWGTVITSAIAMLIAVPLGVGTAAYLSEIAGPRMRRVASFFVEMLAAIPSVVYGFWGMYVLAPMLQTPFSWLGGPNTGGLGILAAGLILSVMIVPYIAAVSFDVCQAVPRSQREGALALGATRWQTIRSVVLPYARPGIVGGCFLALGRALGETMAVTMLIGNKPEIQLSPFALGDSIASVIANQYVEASYELYRSVLVELGLLLLLVTIIVNSLARMLIWRVGRVAPRTGVEPADPAPLPERASCLQPPARPMNERASCLQPPARPMNERASCLQPPARPMNEAAPLAAPPPSEVTGISLAPTQTPPDGTAAPPRRPSLTEQIGEEVKPPLGARQIDWLMTNVLGLCVVVVMSLLVVILAYLVYRGAGALSWDFFVKLPVGPLRQGGGMANGILGSLEIVGLATLFAVPVGLLAAIYLAEYRKNALSSAVRFVGELLGGVPSIVVGIFAAALFAVVADWHEQVFGIPLHFYGWSGVFALAVMMVPIVMRASEEAIKLVPSSLRNASYALGASHAQTVLRVTVPAALPAIITAIFLAIARIAGETAPLLLTAGFNTYWPSSLGDFTPTLPVYIFKYAGSSFPNQQRQAWAAAFVLMAIVMLLNVGIRFVTGKRVVSASRAD